MKLLSLTVFLLVLFTIESLKFGHIQYQNRKNQFDSPHGRMENKWDGFYPIVGINLW
jgi:hypothetical protein